MKKVCLHDWCYNKVIDATKRKCSKCKRTEYRESRLEEVAVGIAYDSNGCGHPMNNLRVLWSDWVKVCKNI